MSLADVEGIADSTTVCASGDSDDGHLVGAGHDDREPSDAAEDGGFDVAPYLLLRTNPMSTRAVTDLGDGEIAELVAELVLLEQEDDLDRDALCDVLYEVIGGLDGDERHEVALPVRRAIHNGRRLPVPEASIAAHCDDPRLHAWYGRSRARDRILQRLGEAYDAGLASERRWLRDHLDQPDFARSLVLSSPRLHELAQDAIEGPEADLDKRDRKAEATLLKYVSRAAAKTSPMARLTVAVHGLWSSRGDLSPALGPWSSRVEPNHLVVRRLLDAVAADDRVRDDVQLRLNPTARVEDGELAYEVDVDDPAIHPRVYGGSERSVRVKLTAAVAAIVRRVRGAAGATRAVLVGELVTATGGTAEAVGVFVDQLVDNGLLLRDLDVPAQTPGIAFEAAEWMRQLGGDVARSVAGHLDDVDRRMHGWGGESADRRADRVRAIEDDFAAAFGIVGTAPPDLPLVFEDAVAPTPVSVETELWQPVLDDCRRAMTVLELFDEQHVATRLVRNRFVQLHGRGGRCDEVRAFTAELESIYEQTYEVTEAVGEPTSIVDEQLVHFLARRDRVMEDVLRGVGGSNSPARLAVESVAALREELPRWVSAEPASYTFFLQPRRDATTGVVHEATANKIYGGWAQYLSRFLIESVDDEVLAVVRSHLAASVPESDVLAELRPVLGFNANLHPRLTPHEIDWQRRGAHAGVSPAELALEHDVVTDRVVLVDPTGRRVHVPYLGFLVPYVLPDRFKALLSFSGGGQIAFDPHGVAEMRLGEESRQEVRAYPPVVHGALTLVRRRWHLPSHELPRQEGDETPAELLARLSRWRAVHGVPPQVFVHPPLPDWGGSDSEEYYASFFANRKPQYVDLTSPLFLLHLPRLLRGLPDELVLEEVDPPLGSALLVDDQGPHVTEALVEVHRAGRTR